ncbi:MAG: SUMF1/EgtB/PvdO family nonheme iron enzyme [Verrucomicrobiaceae bacterium]|nr:SUMF1/EgtB/PvdO family nonheme iron enzyme [Verrucomicrobiaceae bacterium]
MNTWFYSDTQQTYGPITTEQLIAMIQGGQLVAGHFIMANGAQEWQALGTSPFSGYLPPAAPPVAAPAARPGPPVQRPAQPRPASAHRALVPAKKNSPWLAIAAVLVLAAASGGYFWLQRTAAPAFPTATKEQPFINSLGMQFVPVPGTDVLMCVHETRNQDFSAFAAENPNTQSFWKLPNYQNAPIKQEGAVVHVSWFDAGAFCDWLSKKEGRHYRLPTNTEWCLAAGISTDPNAKNPINREEYPSDAKGVIMTAPNHQGFSGIATRDEWLGERMHNRRYMAIRRLGDGFEQSGDGSHNHRGGTGFRCVLAASEKPPTTLLSNPPSRLEATVTYNPADLIVVEQGAAGWLLTDGKVRLQLFDTQEDAELALAMAVEHTERHIIAYGDSMYSFEYWSGNSGIKGGKKTSDVLSYRPEDLFIEQVEAPDDDKLRVWAICRRVNGRVEALKHLDSEGHAIAGLEIAKKCTRRCIIGPSYGKRLMPDRTYQMIYWE